MSLSTQLNRGTLALPLLALFGVLALASGQAADAQPYIAAPKALLVQLADPTACAAASRPAMMLAQAPGDLGPIAHRQLRPSPLRADRPQPAVRVACRPAMTS